MPGKHLNPCSISSVSKQRDLKDLYAIMFDSELNLSITGLWIINSKIKDKAPKADCQEKDKN